MYYKNTIQKIRIQLFKQKTTAVKAIKMNELIYMKIKFPNILLFFIIFYLSFNLLYAGSEKISIIVKSKDAPLEFAAKQLAAALYEKGIKTEITGEPSSGKNSILIGTKKDFKNEQTKSLSAKAESFIITRLNKNQLAVIGSDAAGAMYGALDIAEQIQYSAKNKFSLKDIEGKNKQPFLKLRGVNPFLHVQAMLDTTSWYFSDEFWEDYLNRLAFTRHNFLDIHAAYDLGKTNMPNIFSFFFSDPEYPDIEIPVGREQKPVTLKPSKTKKIFERFLKIVKMASARGIHVGLMNYNTGVMVNGKQLNGKELVAYTRRSVIHLLNACPELWMFGFRVGESGQSEDFFQKAYLTPIEEVNPNINVYTRTWGADITKIRPMGEQLKGHLYVEPKYNGEQLGLPYQAITSPIEGNLPTSYSFEDYCTKPQPYKIIWQVRANGTHRVFHWGDPDFVRRTVRSCTLGDAEGYTVEPLTAYFPLSDYLHKESCAHKGFFKWMPQRNWVWYELWGKLAYDPDIPDSYFRKIFENHYGKEAGSAMFDALRWNSKIVPMIFAYHRLGPDHRQMAPELEVGNDRFVVGGKMYPGTLIDFYLAATLDPEHMQSISEYVDAYLGIPAGTPWPEADVHAGGDSPAIPHELDYPTAKFSPLDAAQYWLDAARKSFSNLRKTANSKTIINQEDFACTAMDIRAVAHLGKYYAYKTLGATDLAFFHRTNDFGRLQSARSWIEKAVQQWDSLASITDKHYRPFPDWLRMKTNTFTWKEEGKKLKRDFIDLDRGYVEVRKMKPFMTEPPRVGWTVVRESETGKDIHIPIFIFSREAVHAKLFYRREGDTGFLSLPFKSSGKPMIYEAVIPADDAKANGNIDYYIELTTVMSDFSDVQIIPRRWELNWIRFDQKGARRTFPEKAPQQIYRLALHGNKKNIKIEAQKPEIKPLSASVKMVHLRIKADDKNGISWVKLYYKDLPSHLIWKNKSMEKDGLYYTASFPVKAEGAMYYFEIANKVGQAVFYPDFQKDTPYLVIPSWQY